MQTIFAGTVITFTSDDPPFTALDGVTLINPDSVIFTYKVNGEIKGSYTWINSSGDPDNVITNVSEGIFKAPIDSTGQAGIWEYSWAGKPFSGVDTTATQVVWRSLPFQVKQDIVPGDLP